MIEIAAYALAVAGAYLFLMSAIIKHNGALSLLLGRVIPALLGAGFLWLSAIVLVQS